MAKTSKRGGGRGAIEIQISAHVTAPLGVTLDKAVIQEAIARKIETGDDPSGIELRIVRWRHPPKGDWKGEGDTDDPAIWQRFGRLLLAARVDVFAIRRDQGGRA